METLFKTEIKQIKNNNIKTINAKLLWSKLKAKSDFLSWINEKIEQFIENEDFVKIEDKNNKKEEYFLTIDCAKTICMLEDNEQGHKIRQYFIQCEKQLKKSNEITGEYLIMLGKEMIKNKKNNNK